MIFCHWGSESNPCWHLVHVLLKGGGGGCWPPPVPTCHPCHRAPASWCCSAPGDRSWTLAAGFDLSPLLLLIFPQISAGDMNQDKTVPALLPPCPHPAPQPQAGGDMGTRGHGCCCRLSVTARQIPPAPQHAIHLLLLCRPRLSLCGESWSKQLHSVLM